MHGGKGNSEWETENRFMVFSFKAEQLLAFPFPSNEGMIEYGTGRKMH
jgi:hypothetical protein